MNPKRMIVIGAFLGLLGITLGAFGAHGLESQLPEWYPSKSEQVKKLETWNTGVRYQMYCAFALLGVGIIALLQRIHILSHSAWLFIAGVILFSGSLYILVLMDIKIFGMVAALGGTCQVIAWLLLLIGSLRINFEDSSEEEHTTQN